MKTHVLKAMVRELQTYLKENEELDQAKLIAVMKKIAKMEVETLESLSNFSPSN